MLSKNVHILVIEDDEVDIENIQRAFKKNSIPNPLHIAHHGLEALNMLKGEGNTEKLDPTPKIILLDVNMPKMSGFEFLEVIRKDSDLKLLSVFILTTSRDEKDIKAAFKANVAGYIVKPVTFEEFTKTIHSLYMYWSITELPF